MHALAPVERYSLWTGDVGVALFAADCLEGRGPYPILESSLRGRFAMTTRSTGQCRRTRGRSPHVLIVGAAQSAP
jgi:hypothetical protein